MSDSRLHWHPSLDPLAKLHDKGKVTVFPAIGYTHPDQSHFTSRHYWEVGALDPQLGAGWLGRLLDVIGDDENAMQGLSLDDSLLPSLATAKVPVATLSDPTQYGFDSQNVWDVPGALLPDAIGSLGGLVDTTDPFLTQASQTAGECNQLRQQLAASSARTARLTTTRRSSIPDGEFASRLSALAALLHAGFPIRAAALQAPGEFDTHSDEAGASRRRPPADEPGTRRLPGGSRAAQPRLARPHLPLERVRPTGGAELLERHRPWRRRGRVHDGRAV